ncbi:MAG TPA: cytochrome c [Pyrinomonadaceae bacterium]|nr:cytochrome c [Pyrinomonadaceae bacterium]
MKYLKIVVVSFFALFAIFACSNSKAKDGIVIADSKSYEASLFRQKCAICHGSEAEGKEIEGKFVPSLRRPEVAQKSEQEIYNQIYNGGNGMLPFKGQLTEKEIRLLVKLVKEDLQTTGAEASRLQTP